MNKRKAWLISAEKKSSENIVKVQKENQEKLVIVIRFQNFQKERKDDQEKMVSLEKLIEDKFKHWEEKLNNNKNKS